MRAIKRFFALLVSAGLFVFLGYVFTVFLNPQGQAGWITAIILTLASAIACLFVYRWMAGPHRQHMPEAEDSGSGLGLGLLGASAAARRRRDEDMDPDDLGGGRRGQRADSDADGDGDFTGMEH